MLQEPIRVYHGWATGSGVELTKAAKGKYRQRDQKQLKNQEGRQGRQDPHDQAQGSCARCCPWVQPSTCFSCLLRKQSQELSLSSRRLQEMNPRWPTESAPVPSIAVKSQIQGPFYLFFMFVGFRHQLIQYQKCLSPFSRRRSLIKTSWRGQTGTQRRGQLGLEQPPKKATILIGRPRSVFNNSSGFPFSFLFHWKPHEQSQP